MSKAIRFEEQGGPEVLNWTEVDVGEPGEGELRLRHTAVGLNFIEIYQRNGLYAMELPSGLGMEAAGTVEAVGVGVTAFKPGDRVAYGFGPTGAYAETRLIPADKVVALPDEIDDRTAAASMLKGMTAQYLLHRTFRLKSGDTALIHAAAGGVGTLLCQWARHLGATVIGTAGSDEKLAMARANGCHHVIAYKHEDFVERVRELTDGQGVNVVYDGVGKATFEGSLDCLRRLGTMVSYGNASGAVDAVKPLDLARRGSLFFTRPLLPHYIATREELEETTRSLFDAIISGAVTVKIGQTYPLKDAGQAQSDLEARQTHGATVLLP
ncbi:MAG: quinone oxidoreductase [Gammaproteobacteria bacterium]|jgi:NADPH2:quinone reductase